jgi:hypothetical protein
MMDSSATWNGQDPIVTSAPQDDFHQYLDIGMSNLNEGLNFEFPDYSGQHNGQAMQQDGGEAMDTRMDVDMGLLAHKDTIMQGQMPPMTTAAAHATIAGTTLDHGHSSSDSLVELDAQIQYLQQQRQQHQQRQMQEQQQRNFYATQQNRMVPPTPNSIEMHGSNSQYYPAPDPQQQAMDYRYQMRVKEQEVSLEYGSSSIEQLD